MIGNDQSVTRRTRFLRAGGGIVAVIALACALWLIGQNNHWFDRWIPNRLRVIDEGDIYASGQISRYLIRDVFTSRHIQLDISLCGEGIDSDPDQVAERNATRDLGITLLECPLAGDGTGDIHQYARAITAMVEAKQDGKPVLVHCYAGVERSGVCTAFYRVLVEGWTARAAVAELKKNRWTEARNPKMLPYLNEHVGELAQLLVDAGVIAKVPDPLPRFAP
jgi:predicted protein tyrosine phosphatase